MANGMPAAKSVRRKTRLPRRVLFPREFLKSTSQLKLDCFHKASWRKYCVAASVVVASEDGTLKGLQAGMGIIGVLSSSKSKPIRLS